MTPRPVRNPQAVCIGYSFYGGSSKGSWLIGPSRVTELCGLSVSASEKALAGGGPRTIRMGPNRVYVEVTDKCSSYSTKDADEPFPQMSRIFATS